MWVSVECRRLDVCACKGYAISTPVGFKPTQGDVISLADSSVAERQSSKLKVLGSIPTSPPPTRPTPPTWRDACAQRSIKLAVWHEQAEGRWTRRRKDEEIYLLGVECRRLDVCAWSCQRVRRPPCPHVPASAQCTSPGEAEGRWTRRRKDEEIYLLGVEIYLLGVECRRLDVCVWSCQRVRRPPCPHVPASAQCTSPGDSDWDPPSRRVWASTCISRADYQLPT